MICCVVVGYVTELPVGVYCLPGERVKPSEEETVVLSHIPYELLVEWEAERRCSKHLFRPSMKLFPNGLLKLNQAITCIIASQG